MKHIRHLTIRERIAWRPGFRHASRLSVIPAISDASSQLIFPLIARVITSRIFIARSKAQAGYNVVQPLHWLQDTLVDRDAR
jgi:hypothetical protein